MILSKLENIIAYESQLRLASFFSALFVMGLWEVISPRRPLSIRKRYRWINNLGIVIFSSILVRIVFPLSVVGVAFYVNQREWGLLSVADLPFWPVVLFSIVILDFAVWVQHVLFHAVPALWRLHRMHHADLDFDVTTGLRFHPIEIFLSIGIKAGVIILFGMPVLAVLLFEIILNVLAMFNHSNVRIPLSLDRLLRLFVVTPDMHRVHHSWHQDESNSNFGFNLPCWDRLLGTYRAQPRDGHERMNIGMHQFREQRWLRIDRMLIQPFVKEGKTRNLKSV
ncbi:MAG: sterol desaturase [Bdellovibrionales bacterium GWA2_49_15]|nr:MAG: sterol desaturase [Bdellovibrionales bacterium GWA2_49_15]HAZ13386.1 sterol desaturase [Bdellovibrionales bacterium]